MPAITASMVADLRAKTDAPMMMCKKALTEADGDAVKAEELLRVKLGTKAAGAGSRVTSEGVVASYVAGNVVAMVEVNCETDFVTKNDDFIAFARTIAALIAAQAPADLLERTLAAVADERAADEPQAEEPAVRSAFFLAALCRVWGDGDCRIGAYRGTDSRHCAGAVQRQAVCVCAEPRRAGSRV